MERQIVEFCMGALEKICKHSKAFRQISIILGYLQIDSLSHPEYQKCDFILPNLPEPTKE